MLDYAEAFVGEASTVDWREPFIEYLNTGALPQNPSEAAKIKRFAKRFKVENGELYKKRFDGSWLSCVLTGEVMLLLSILHEGDASGHPSRRRLWQIALHQGLYWPTMEEDAMKYVKRCLKCQKHGDEIDTNHQSLRPTSTSRPFHT
jgi:hypothetical protein